MLYLGDFLFTYSYTDEIFYPSKSYHFNTSKLCPGHEYFLESVIAKQKNDENKDSQSQLINTLRNKLETWRANSAIFLKNIEGKCNVYIKKLYRCQNGKYELASSY